MIFLDNVELKRVVAAAKKKIGRNLDILGMDACLMSMAEIRIPIGCDGAGFYRRLRNRLEPGDGWPWHHIDWAISPKNPNMKPRDLSKSDRQALPPRSYGTNDGE